MNNDILYIITIVACIIFVVFGPKIQIWWEKRSKKDDNSKSDTPEPHYVNITDKDGNKLKVIDFKRLFIDTLSQLNCTATEDKDVEGRLNFTYQSLNFFADTNPGKAYVDIFLTWWGNVDLDDIDAVAALQKAANTANYSYSVLPKVIYTYDTENNKMAIHTRATIPFMPEMPDLKTYLRAVFDQFFAINRFTREEFDRNFTKEQDTEEHNENS